MLILKYNFKITLKKYKIVGQIAYYSVNTYIYFFIVLLCSATTPVGLVLLDIKCCPRTVCGCYYRT